MAKRSEQAGHFKAAINIIDQSEPLIRDIIESGLIGVTEDNMTKKKMVEAAVQHIMPQIVAVRTKAIKDAFRYLRTNLSDV